MVLDRSFRQFLDGRINRGIDLQAIGVQIIRMLAVFIDVFKDVSQLLPQMFAEIGSNATLIALGGIFIDQW